MNYLSILAQAEAAGDAENFEVVPIDFIWEQITALSWLQAVLAISFGVVYLLYGWRIFKVLVTISFALIGLFLGIHFGEKAGSEMWGGIIGVLIFAIVSVPLMKWCVCILGAVAGGILTGGLWYAFDLPQMYIWAGAAVGIVAGGMMSFIVFEATVILFTSLGGSAITTIAVLALLYRYEISIDPLAMRIQNLVLNHNWFLPVALMVPTIIGIIMQRNLARHSSK